MVERTPIKQRRVPELYKELLVNYRLEPEQKFLPRSTREVPIHGMQQAIQTRPKFKAHRTREGHHEQKKRYSNADSNKRCNTAQKTGNTNAAAKGGVRRRNSKRYVDLQISSIAV